MDGSFGKEATVAQLPISKEIAGVSMRLEPGVTRELHWHATAAEWAFVMEGRVRTATLDPLGRFRNQRLRSRRRVAVLSARLSARTVLPRQYAVPFHPDFRQRVFLRVRHVQHYRLAGHASPKLLAKNFGVAEATFAGIPKEKAYFVRGGLPPAEAVSVQGALYSPPETFRYRMLAQEPHSIHEFGREWRVGSNRFPISQTMTGVILDLEPGGLRELHWHPNADEWQYVIESDFSVSLFGSHGRYRVETLSKGDVGYIPQGYGHSIENVGNKVGRVLIGLNTGNYQAIDLSQWIASNPAYARRALRQAADGFRDFPQGARVHLAA